MAHQIGETILCSITVTDDGTLADPATSMNISCEGQKPELSAASVLAATAMTKDSTGTYHYDLQTAGFNKGTYLIKYIATDGTKISITTDTFELE